jgi:tetratricopeptide (TPR) repeat protein
LIEGDAVDGMTEYPLIETDELVKKAWAAMGEQATEEALELWRLVREHSPDRPEGHVWPVQALWRAGQFDEAEAAAEAAFAKFPDHPDLLVQYAWIATKQERWEDAIRRWAVVRAGQPDLLESYVYGARALWHFGRPDRAEALIAEALRRFPDDEEALVESAWTALVRQDWDEAARRWLRVRARRPNQPESYARTAQVLRMAGRPDEAEKLATEGLARFPDDTELLVEHIWAAVVREDWPAAEERLQKVRVDKPREYEQRQQGFSAIEERIRTRTAPLPPVPPGSKGATPVSAALDPEEIDDGEDDMSPGELVLGFESIGERCDFGSVQRQFGVEPLGLLRFAFSPMESLLAGLKDRFEVVGTPEDTAFAHYADETILRMEKYNLVFHTFDYQISRESAERQEAFFQQQRRRLQFLKQKLIDDLEEQEKIWVYASGNFVSDDDAARLFAALRGYGPNSLLYVRPADASHPVGAVERLEDGFYAGYVPWMADFAAGGQPPFEIWRQICARTYRMAKTANGQNGAAPNGASK